MRFSLLMCAAYNYYYDFFTPIKAFVSCLNVLFSYFSNILLQLCVIK